MTNIDVRSKLTLRSVALVAGLAMLCLLYTSDAADE